MTSNRGRRGVWILATNSIRQGANRTVIDRIRGFGDIFYAWSDRPWTLDGAAVRASFSQLLTAGKKLPDDEMGK